MTCMHVDDGYWIGIGFLYNGFVRHHAFAKVKVAKQKKKKKKKNTNKAKFDVDPYQFIICQFFFFFLGDFAGKIWLGILAGLIFIGVPS